MKTRTFQSILFFVIFLTPILCQGQKKQNQTLILGTWELIEKEKDEELSIFDFGDSKSESNEKKEPEIILYFQEDGILDFKQSGTSYKAKYSIKESTLQMGNRSYKIKKLTNEELIIEEVSDFLPQTFNYRKSDLKITTIKQNEKVEEKFPNGILKLEGQLNGGFKDGVWIERYENGQIKSVTYYTDEAKLMTVEFEPDGKTKSKSWLDPKTGQTKKE
jgi:antitoxin component YwqK of YwqJK toxin-antitoxin module